MRYVCFFVIGELKLYDNFNTPHTVIVTDQVLMGKTTDMGSEKGKVSHITGRIMMRSITMKCLKSLHLVLK